MIFLANLSKDQKGKIVLSYAHNKGSAMLNNTNQPQRGITQRKVDIIKEIIFKIKGGIITNIVKNINHQCQAGSLTESASAFNLNQLIGLDERFNQIKKLYSLYGMYYIHSVKNIDEDMRKEYIMELTYSTKIKFLQEELLKEF